MKRPPSKLVAPPWGDGPMGFRRVIQPVLDRRCIRCHDGSPRTDKKDTKSFDLRGLQMVIAPAPYDRDQGPQHAVSDSFLKLVGYVSYVKVGGYPGRRLPLATNATGSRASKLMKILADGGHYKVKLKTDEWRAFAAWIDCNAPFYGGWDEIVIGKPRRPRPPAVTAEQASAASARRKAITSKLPSGQRLDTYFNCGAGQSPEKKDSVRITMMRGRPWNFANPSVSGVSPAQTRIAFDDREVLFDVVGLSADRKYKVVLTWWDYDTDKRKQSVWISNFDGSGRIRAVKSIALPSYNIKKQPPAELSFAIDELRAKAGKCKLAIRKEGRHNSVICEIWITSQKQE